MVYALSVYSPRVYAPASICGGTYMVYALSVYSPGVYAPASICGGTYMVYAPSVYSPGVYAPPQFVEEPIWCMPLACTPLGCTPPPQFVEEPIWCMPRLNLWRNTHRGVRAGGVRHIIRLKCRARREFSTKPKDILAQFFSLCAMKPVKSEPDNSESPVGSLPLALPTTRSAV